MEVLSTEKLGQR